MRSRIAWCGHLPGLKSDLTVDENFIYANKLGIGMIPAEEQILALGLGDVRSHPVRRLSAGQRRRAALALATSSDKDVWILDEPHTHLDAAARGVIDELLDKHAEQGGIAVVATHEPLHVSESRLVVHDMSTSP